jgi:hypothetical protein
MDVVVATLRTLPLSCLRGRETLSFLGPDTLRRRLKGRELKPSDIIQEAGNSLTTQGTLGNLGKGWRLQPKDKGPVFLKGTK